MKVRQFVAATAIATAAVFATAGIAGAQTTPTTPAPSGSVNHPKACDRATDRLAKLDARRVHSEQVIDRINKRIADAKAHHRDDLVARLEARLATVQKAHDRVVDLITKIHQRCSV